jgi:hypothetical protein
MRQTRVLLTLLCIFIMFGKAAAASTPNRHVTSPNAKMGRIATLQPLAPQNALAYTVLPQVQILVDAWVEYNTLTCTEISTGSWAVTTAPTYGATATGIVTGYLGNGDCPGVQFQFAAIYYTWTSSDPNAMTDFFAATWTSPDFIVDDSVTITLASVTIQSADLVNNNVAITINGPSGTTAPLVVNVKGANNTYTLNYNNGNAVGSGQYSVALTRPDMVQDVYSSIEADWNASTPPIKGTFTLPTPWNVRGTVQNTVYIKVYEDACSGTGTSGYWTFDSSSCTFTAVNLKPLFASQTYLNGTGLTSGGSLVHANPTDVCRKSYPKGASKSNTFYTVSGITGSCGNAMNDGDVATYPNPRGGGTYSCNDQLLYVDLNSNQNAYYPQVVEDYCPACRRHAKGTDDHVDNYFDKSTCTANSLPNYWEADLGSGAQEIQIPVSQPITESAANTEQASYRDNEITVQSEKVGDKLVVSITSQQGRKDVPLPPEIFRIQQIQRYVDRIIVVGDVGASVSQVMIISVNNGAVSDSFLAYNPAISPDGRFIAFVKWFPPHFTSDTDDHQMLYDMTKTPIQNRPAAAAVDDSVDVGLNVYPGNGNKDGDNVHVPERLAHTFPGLDFWSPDSTELVFADQTQSSLKLVLVKVSGPNAGTVPTAFVMPLDHTSVCAAPLSNSRCEAYLDQVKFQAKRLQASFSGTGTKGSIHRELLVKDTDFVALR